MVKLKATRRVTAVLLILPLLLLAGCVDANMHITVNRDGSGIYRLQVLTNPLLSSELQPIRNQVEAEGYRVKELERGDKTGWIAEKRVASIADDPPGRDLMEQFSPAGKTAGLTPFLQDREQGPLSVDNGFLTSRFLFKQDVDLKRLATENPFGRAFIDEMNLDLKLTLPLQPKRHNADTASRDGKTLTWEMEPGEKNPVFVEVEVPNPVGWLILGGILLLAGAVGVLLWFRHRSRRRRKLS